MVAKTRVSISELRKLWYGGVIAKKICAQFNISDSSLRRLVRKHGLPRRKISGLTGKNYEKDPTPKEIAERSLFIRNGWSDKEKERRYVGEPLEGWSVPTAHYDAKTGEFSHD